MAGPDEFDQYRPPEEPRRRGGKRRGARGGRRRRGEELMVPEAEIERFDSYYGKPIVKFPPWEWPIAGYLFLGGLAGGSAMLGAGAQLTGNTELARNARLTAFGAASVGSAFLVADLGRPERLLNMFRVFKLSSPMNVGAWILGGFSGLAAIPAAREVDVLSDERLPLPGAVRDLLRLAATPAGLGAGLLGSPLAAYTAVLLGDTSVPAWQGARNFLAPLFVSSASCAAGGAGLVTTSSANSGPARALAVAGAVGDVAAMHALKDGVGDVMREAFEAGKAGVYLRAAEALVVGGGVLAAVAGRRRVAGAVAGAALMAGSCLTRFGVMAAGRQSVADPKYVVEPQRERLARRVAAGDVGDSITTAN